MLDDTFLHCQNLPLVCNESGSVTYPSFRDLTSLYDKSQHVSCWLVGVEKKGILYEKCSRKTLPASYSQWYGVVRASPYALLVVSFGSRQTLYISKAMTSGFTVDVSVYVRSPYESISVRPILSDNNHVYSLITLRLDRTLTLLLYDIFA